MNLKCQFDFLEKDSSWGQVKLMTFFERVRKNDSFKSPIYPSRLSKNENNDIFDFVMMNLHIVKMILLNMP